MREQYLGSFKLDDKINFGGITLTPKDIIGGNSLGVALTDVDATKIYFRYLCDDYSVNLIHGLQPSTN